MPRVARAVVVGHPYHVTQRGNNRQDVFFASDDYRYYLDLLAEYANIYQLQVLGYCLMTNHVHLVVVPHHPESLSRGIGRTHLLYTQYINSYHGRSGHLWQGRFHSVVLDDTHLCYALRYVERNPVRARMVRKAWRYRWSSAAAHVGESPDGSGLLDLASWQAEWPGRAWQAQLVDPQDDASLSRFRLHTRTGRPLGSDRFVSKIESKLGRRLRARPVGRPKKKKRMHKTKTQRKNAGRTRAKAAK